MKTTGESTMPSPICILWSKPFNVYISGDIGGSIGLFVGASVLTAFEILDVFVHNALKIHLRSGSRRKRKHKINGEDRNKPESKSLTGEKDKYNMYPSL